MSYLEKYKWFQNGIVKAGVSITTQKFFKTNPTEEQLMLLDEINKANGIYWGLVIFLCTILGLLIGYVLANLQFAMNSFLKTLGA